MTLADDPTVTDPEHYRVVLENPRVRVLEYADRPGDATHPHDHPDSVMITLTAFERQLTVGDTVRSVSLPAHLAAWLPAQRHSGENTGETETRVIFVELKDPVGGPRAADTSDPSTVDAVRAESRSSVRRELGPRLRPS